MAFYYVRDDQGSNVGTATGDAGRFATKKTGTWASAFADTTTYYANLAAVYAATTPPVEGDYILCANDHNAIYTVATTLTDASDKAKGYTFCVSVDVDAVDEEKVGAEEETASNYDFTFNANIYFSSMTFQTGKQLTLASGDRNCLYDSCQLVVDATNRTCYITGNVTLIDTDVTPTFAVLTAFSIQTGGNLLMHGGSIIGTSTIDRVYSDGDRTGGARFYGVDMSGVDHVKSALTNGTTENSTATFEMCKVKAGFTFFLDSIPDSIYGAPYVMTNCADTSQGAEYQFLWLHRGSQAEDDTAIYRDNSTAYPSGTKISIKASTDTQAGKSAPFYFDLPSRYVDFSDPASDTVTIYLLCADTLLDTDVWCDLIYPDGTEKNLYNYLQGRKPNILDETGTELSTSTETWIGDSGFNKYELALDTSSNAGSAGVPMVRCYIAKPSVNVYLCSTLGVS